MTCRATIVLLLTSLMACGCTEDEEQDPDAGRDGGVIPDLDGGDGMDATATPDAGGADAGDAAGPDASDAGACPLSEKPDCCCEGDSIDSPECTDAGWECRGLHEPYFEPTCSMECGPCWSPCADAGEGDDVDAGGV